MKKISLPVVGMTCASCVVRVERALKKVDGVQDVSVNLATEKATLAFDPARTSLETLSAVVDDAGYSLVVPDDNARRSERAPAPREALAGLRRDFFLSASFAIPVMVIGMVGMHGMQIGPVVLSPSDVNSLLLLLTTPVMFLPGRKFFALAWKAARHFTADMNTLVAIGTGTAYLYSAALILFPAFAGRAASHGGTYFDTAATIITLILFGRMLESRAKTKTGEALRSLLALQAQLARVRRGDAEIDMPISDVVVGDIIIVRPGEKFPVDGIVIQGSTTSDESLVTGESLPVDRTTGDTVIAGTISVTGGVVMRATAVGDDTVIAHIARMVEEAQASRAPIQNLADRIAAVFVPVVMGISAITFAGWLVFGSVPFAGAMMHAIAVLIIACPCALGLATPTAIIVGTGAGARKGILIRSAASLERMSDVTTMVFDKTGTITRGEPAVGAIHVVNGFNGEHVLARLAAVEGRSEHPLARAIVRYAEGGTRERLLADDFTPYPGGGVTGRVGETQIVAGSDAFLRERGIDVTGVQPMFDDARQRGALPVGVAIDGVVALIVELADPVKDTSRDALDRLRDGGLELVMLTGDHEVVARGVAAQVGIEQIVAGVMPDRKAGVVRQLQSEGKIVAMIGDGVNDAPALAQADVSIAMGSGTDVAKQTADITLMKSDLRGVVDAVTLSKGTVRILRQNFFWAFIYNIVGIPLAAFGLLNPMIAAAAMALSSVSVVSNSLRIRGVLKRQ